MSIENSRLSLATECVRAQPRLHQTLSQKEQKHRVLLSTPRPPVPLGANLCGSKDKRHACLDIRAVLRQSSEGLKSLGHTDGNAHSLAVCRQVPQVSACVPVTSQNSCTQE